ncbi:MAG: alpha/beta hydrolase [Acutalibacteraceae bacterium]|nr:alpha/beta hydrolase [Acutalibacteraceae bacterium]
MKNKIKKAVSFILVFVLAFSCVPFCTVYASQMPELSEYGFIENNGVKIEYGIYGDMNAEPLLLLPPNGGDMHCFDGSILPEMSKHFKVITVSPRYTGNSDMGNDGLTFEIMSDDLIVLLDTLGVEKTKIFGFSDGGNLGMVFTVAHPERVESLVIMGSNINPLGTKVFDQIGIIWKYLGLAIKAGFTGAAEDIRRRDIQGLMVYQPNLTFEDLQTIKVPVLNIYGEHDMIKRIHSKRITKNIPDAQEIMIVGGGHGSCFDYTDTIINPALLDFYGVS